MAGQLSDRRVTLRPRTWREDSTRCPRTLAGGRPCPRRRGVNGCCDVCWEAELAYLRNRPDLIEAAVKKGGGA